MANLSIAAATIALLLASCAYFDIVLLKGFGWLFIVGSVFEMLTLVVYASKVTDAPHNASFWWGSALAIATSVASLLSGILTIQLPPSDFEVESQPSGKRPQSDSPVAGEHARPMRPGTETTTETILPNGKRKYTTTRWNKDGSKTVEESLV